MAFSKQITIKKKMTEYELNEWEINVKKEVRAQIILNRLKKLKKISRKQEREIKKKIKLFGYKNLLKSPHLEGREDLRQKAMQLCLHDYCSFMGFTKNSPFH